MNKKQILNKTKIKFLRKLAHELKPVVMLGTKGLSDTVLDEIDNALRIHELIKIQIGGSDKKERKTIVTDICSKSSAVHIYTVGKQGVFYRERKGERRKSDKPKIDFKETIN